MRLLFLLLLSGIGFSQTRVIKGRAPHLNIDYDRFADKTYVNLSMFTTDDDMLQISSINKGKDLKKPDTLVVLLSCSHDEWNHLRAEKMFMILDESERFELNGTYDGKVGSGYVIEKMAATITWETFEKLASSKIIEAKMNHGNHIIKIDRTENVIKIKEMKAMLANQPKKTG